MTSNEAATALGLDPDTVRGQCENGKLVAEKHGRQWWITPGAVERYRETYLGTRAKKETAMTDKRDVCKCGKDRTDMSVHSGWTIETGTFPAGHHGFDSGFTESHLQVLGLPPAKAKAFEDALNKKLAKS